MRRHYNVGFTAFNQFFIREKLYFFIIGVRHINQSEVAVFRGTPMSWEMFYCRNDIVPVHGIDKITCMLVYFYRVVRKRSFQLSYYRIIFICIYIDYRCKIEMNPRISALRPNCKTEFLNERIVLDCAKCKIFGKMKLNAMIT